MIEALKSDDLVNSVGGRFKLCVLVQRRVRELMEGARPLVERQNRSDIEIAIDEIQQGKISIDWTPSSAGALPAAGEEPLL